MEGIDENTQLSDEQMDELVSRTEEPQNREIPMTREEVAPPARPEPDSYEFQDSAGNKFKATRDDILKWREQVSGLPQKLQKVNQERQAWETQRSEWEQRFAPYRQIDEWATKNKDQWERIRESVQKAMQGVQPTAEDANNPYLRQMQALESRLQQFEPIIQTLAQSHQESVKKAEDEKLDQEIRSIQDQYKDLDWKSPDQDGKSLEYKVLEHAQKNGIQNFGTAFRDFYHDQLIARATAQAQQSVAKGVQAKTKLGILGESPIPKKGIAPVKDVKNKSYENIMDEIREEIKQGAYG